MSNKKAVISIIALVVVTWVLISSLSAIPVTNSQSGSTGTGGGTGSGTGTGTGSGTGSLFGFHFPSLKLNLPNLNIGASLANLFSKLHIKFPNLNVTLPQTGAKANATSTSPGGGGGGTGSTSSSHNAITPLVINPLLLEIFMVIFIGLAVLMVIKSTFSRKKDRKPDNSGMDGELFEYNSKEVEERGLQIEKDASAKTERFIPRSIPQVMPFSPWKGEGLIKPDIPEDMPLFARAGKNLNINYPENMKLFSNDGEMLRKPEVQITEGKNTLKGQSDSGNETKTIMGIDPKEDSQRQMIANFGENILNRNRTKTLREIMSESNLSGLISNKESLYRAVSIYEKIYYGKRDINMNDYYEFLRSLKNSLKEPKIFMQ